MEINFNVRHITIATAEHTYVAVMYVSKNTYNALSFL